MLALRIRKGIVDHLAIRLAEWLLTAEAACFAETLLGPGETFASSPSYAFMSRFASEPVWGGVIGLVAVLRLAALVANGSFPSSRRGSPLIRSLCAGLSAGVWFSISVGFCVSNPNGTGWKTYGILMIFDVALSIMIARPAGTAIQAYRGVPHGRT